MSSLIQTVPEWHTLTHLRKTNQPSSGCSGSDLVFITWSGLLLLVLVWNRRNHPKCDTWTCRVPFLQALECKPSGMPWKKLPVPLRLPICPAVFMSVLSNSSQKILPQAFSNSTVNMFLSIDRCLTNAEWKLNLYFQCKQLNRDDCQTTITSHNAASAKILQYKTKRHTHWRFWEDSLEFYLTSVLKIATIPLW